MRVAVIGAGIVGVTSAYEFIADGHEVTVFERHASVAEGTSFADAGLIAPGCVAPWAAPGAAGTLPRQLFTGQAAVRLARLLARGQLRWAWRWLRACRTPAYVANRTQMVALARYSQQRLQALIRTQQLHYERSRGLLVLLRSARELKRSRASLSLLADLGVKLHLVGPDRARQIEPGLDAATPLHAAIHLPDDEVGNCRQFAQVLRAQATQRGADFRFQREVLAIAPGPRPRVRHRGASGGAPVDDEFDAVVVCAALGAAPLLRPLGLRLPLLAVHGCSLTAPLRQIEGHPEIGPASAVMDEQYKVAISRLGARVRVAGSAEIGGTAQRIDTAALATLHKALDDWYPGCAQLARAQVWKGVRPMLPDGPPVIGASGAPGVWLNLGHGSSGWALACGSARVLADRVGARRPEIDVARLDLARLRR